METEYRISRLLSYLGITSRRKAPDFLLNNDVQYRGKKITELNTKININSESILLINGHEYPLEKKFEYILFHKPPGYIVSHLEKKNQKSVFRLLPNKIQSYYYAGRLDKESRGLMILSNDGDYIYQLTHPSHGIVKKYIVQTSRPLSTNELKKIEKGVFYKNIRYRFHSIQNIDKSNHYEIHLSEGKNREIRKVMEKFGVRVLDLHRFQLGSYTLSGLQEGKWRKTDKK